MFSTSISMSGEPLLNMLHVTGAFAWALAGCTQIHLDMQHIYVGTYKGSIPLKVHVYVYTRNYLLLKIISINQICQLSNHFNLKEVTAHNYCIINTDP